MKNWFFVLFMIVLASCQVENSFYVIPADLSQIPADPMNPLTAEKVESGMFFLQYKGLSDDGRVSCFNCHDPAKGWTTPDAEFVGGCGQGCILHEDGRLELDPSYVGFVDTMNFVKSYGAAGAAYMEVLGRSGRFGATGMNGEIIEDLATHYNLRPDQIELCDPLLFQALRAQPGHRQLLEKRIREDSTAQAALEHAFPDVVLANTHIDSIRWLIAQTMDAAQRVEGLTHIYDTKFQKVMNGEMQFTLKENRGYEIFMTNCQNCHSNEVMGGGLEKSFIPPNRFNADHRAEITHVEGNDILRLTPPLRNMLFDHSCFGFDCSYGSVESFMEDKYKSLDIQLTDYDKRSVIAFLKTL